MVPAMADKPEAPALASTAVEAPLPIVPELSVRKAVIAARRAAAIASRAKVKMLPNAPEAPDRDSTMRASQRATAAERIHAIIRDSSAKQAANQNASKRAAIVGTPAPVRTVPAYPVVPRGVVTSMLFEKFAMSASRRAKKSARLKGFG